MHSQSKDDSVGVFAGAAKPALLSEQMRILLLVRLVQYNLNYQCCICILRCQTRNVI
jgi:hypothetical protein